MSKQWMFTGVICGVFLWELITRSLCFTGVYMQADAFTPVNKVLSDPAVFLFAPLRHTSNTGCIIRELLEVTVHGVVGEVWFVEGEKEGREHCTLRGPHGTYNTQSLSLTYCGLLVRKSVVHVAWCWSTPGPSGLPLCQLYCIKSTGEVKNMTLTVRLVFSRFVSVLCSRWMTKMVSKLKVGQRHAHLTDVPENNTLHGFHQVRS